MDDMSWKRVKGGYYAPGTPEYKEFMKEVEPLIKSGKTNISPSHNMPLPENKFVRPENYIPARRADPLGKHGSKDRIETIDYGYDKETIGRLLNAYNDAVKRHGVPKMSADDLTNMALVEGRSNFGYNGFDYNNKKSNAIAQDLVKLGHDPYAAGFPAAIADRMADAQRRGVDFYHAWNGGGPEAKKYSQRIEQQRYAVEHPKNQPLRNFIKQKIGALDTDQNMSEAEPDQNISQVEAEPDMMRRGGSVRMPDSYSQGSWKLI